MVWWFLLMLQQLLVLRIAVGFRISKPNCVDHCGDVKIPYPFGIGADCYHNRSHEIICNTSFGSSKPFLRQFNLEVINIIWPGRYTELDEDDYVDRYDISQVLIVGLPRKNICESSGIKKNISYDLKGSPYQFLMESNALMLEGCGSRAAIKNRNGEIMASCDSVCIGDDVNMIGTTCNRDGCCTASVSSDQSTEAYEFDFFEIDVAFEQQSKFDSCNASVALIDTNSMKDFTGSLSSLQTFPTALGWESEILSQLCDNGRCDCADFHEGNPYLPNGCQVVPECQNCKNRCDVGYYSSGGSYYYCKKHLLFRRASFLAFFIGAGVVLLALGSYWLYRFVKRKREIKQKAKHFKRNGGLLLEQRMSSDEGVVETTKVFTVTELEKATDNFNDNRIIGQGGQGMVYKGMLMDGKIVAIKTAKKVDESQVEQFINEVHGSSGDQEANR